MAVWPPVTAFRSEGDKFEPRLGAVTFCIENMADTSVSGREMASYLHRIG